MVAIVEWAGVVHKYNFSFEYNCLLHEISLTVDPEEFNISRKVHFEVILKTSEGQPTHCQ